MRKILPVLIVVLVFIVSFSKTYSHSLREPTQTRVSAMVGQFSLSVSGYISPYASIVLTMLNGTLLRSTVADGAGDFSISQVLIQKGFSGFCLEAIDFKRIGQSTTCFNIAPATSSIVMKNLFLPPTLGLYRNKIAVGSTAIAFGYTMPDAKAMLHLSNGSLARGHSSIVTQAMADMTNSKTEKVLTVASDGSGFYRFNINGVQAGVYNLYSRAEYKHKLSLSPSKAIELTALSWLDQIIEFIKNLWNKIIGFITSVGLGPLWIGLPIIILIIILILKLWPEKFTIIYENKLLTFFSRKTKRLHHWWWVGY